MQPLAATPTRQSDRLARRVRGPPTNDEALQNASSSRACNGPANDRGFRNRSIGPSVVQNGGRTTF
eukprot:9477060-Pyramimonas_sp.AAC.1